MWTRRALLTATAAATLAPSPPALRPKNLIVVLAWGGWDTSLGLDPKPDAPVALPDGQVQTFGDIDVWAADARPALASCFERWWPVAHVVRGISVRSVAHVVCHRRLLTGGPDPSAPDLAAIVASNAAADVPVPYLILGTRAQPGRLGSLSATTGLQGQIANLAADAPADPEAARMVADWLARSDRRLRDRSGEASVRAAELLDARARGRKLLGRDLQIPVDTDFEGQSEVAVAALADGLCRAVTLDTQLDFDTHVDNYRQAELTDALFVGVDGLLAKLAGTTSTDTGRALLDDTTVLLVSEMTRTPQLNGGGGKDHWPFAVTALFGAGVRSGVTGATDATQAGLPVDLSTGGPGDTPLLTEQWFAGVLAHFDVDPGAWSDAAPLASFTA